MSKEKDNKKVRKTGKVVGIVIKILLFFVGVAMLAFFAWLGVQIALVLKFKV